MREEPAFLEHIADAAAMRRDKDAARRIGQSFAIDRDMPTGRPIEPGDCVDQRGLAGAGTAEQRGEPARAVERGVKGETAEPVGDRNAQH